MLTAPHTAIVVDLVLIAWAGGAGVLFATLDRVDTRLRWGGLRIPWSAGLLGLLGLSAVAGFPLDELWHQTYGVDVTMWSPTHMLMILVAAFSGAASWLVLAEAGVPVSGRRWWRGLHVVAAWLTLQGLTAPLGEFAFGVPQFNQLFHPLIICMAAGLAVVAMRLVLGRGWAFGIVFVSFLLDQSNLLAGGNDGPVRTRAAAMYLVSAAVVEVVALLLGTERRPRFALVTAWASGPSGWPGSGPGTRTHTSRGGPRCSRRRSCSAWWWRWPLPSSVSRTATPSADVPARGRRDPCCSAPPPCWWRPWPGPCPDRWAR
ncbi:hypothetical protein BH18ACT1_BH18ACT1_07920 [soil metagenome]